MNGLALLVQEGLGGDSFAGDVFVFRGRAGSLIKALCVWRARAAGAVFYYSRDRAGKHPEAHLAKYTGMLQADAYNGWAAHRHGIEGAGALWSYRPKLVTAGIGKAAYRGGA